jgi:hypothetical protein
LREARAHGAALRVVTAWHYPYTTDISGMVPMTAAGLNVAEDAHKLQDRALEDALLLEPFPGGAVEIERVVTQGSAAPCARASRNAHRNAASECDDPSTPTTICSTDPRWRQRPAATRAERHER